MKTILAAVALCAALVPQPAYAERILFFGDSMMNTGAPNHWPVKVCAATGDACVVNSVNGRNTVEGLAQIDAAIAAAASPTDCVIGLGVVDLLEAPSPTPASTVARLEQIADRCALAGATPHVLTPPHAPVWGPFWFGYLDGEAYTREIARLLRDDFPYNVIDQRDRVGWKLHWNQHSSDGLHPTGDPLRAVMAEPVIEMFQ